MRVCLFVNIAASRAAKQQLPAAAPQAKTSTSSRCLPALTWGVRRQRVLKAVHAPISPPPVVFVSASARVTDGEKFEAAPLAAAVHINARILSKLFGKPECDGISPDKGCASALPVPVARIPHAGAASEWVDDGRTGYSTWCEPPRRGLCAVEALLARTFGEQPCMYQASLEKRRREAWGSPATTAVPAFGCRRDGRADYSNPEPWSNECTVDTSS